MPVKEVREIPPFPENSAGLVRGSVLCAKDEIVSQLGLKLGDKIIIGFDGEYVCAQRGFTWDIDQITEEIRHGVWEVVETIDLSNRARATLFHWLVEDLKLIE